MKTKPDGQALRMEIEQRQCLESLRSDIRAGFAAVQRGEYSDYDVVSIKTLARRLKACGRRRLAADSERHSKR
jgi:hypothetical protein